MIFSEETLELLKKEFPCFRDLKVVTEILDAHEIEMIVGKSKFLATNIMEKSRNSTESKNALSIKRLRRAAQKRIDLHEKIVKEIFNYEEKEKSLTVGEYYSINPPHVVNKKEISIVKCLSKFGPNLYLVKGKLEGAEIRFNLDLNTGTKASSIKLAQLEEMIITSKA